MYASRIGSLLALPLLLLTAGCGGLGLVQVSGKLTCKGEPVPSTEVYFQPEDGSRPSHGKTDDQGRFKLRFTRKRPGCSLGRHTVTLRYSFDSDEMTHQVPPRASAELKQVIARYGDPQTSPLHYEVKTQRRVLRDPDRVSPISQQPQRLLGGWLGDSPPGVASTHTSSMLQKRKPPRNAVRLWPRRVRAAVP